MKYYKTSCKSYLYINKSMKNWPVAFKKSVFSNEPPRAHGRKSPQSHKKCFIVHCSVPRLSFHKSPNNIHTALDEIQVDPTNQNKQCWGKPSKCSDLTWSHFVRRQEIIYLNILFMYKLSLFIHLVLLSKI